MNKIKYKKNKNYMIKKIRKYWKFKSLANLKSNLILLRQLKQITQ